MGTSISFKRPDGKDANGYLANAARGNAPGVVVIQEWWGLSDQIKGLCDRFALAGFDALAPDLYKGKVVPYHDTDAAGKEMNSLDFIDATTQTVRGAAQYLGKQRRQGRPDRLLSRRRGDHHRRGQDSGTEPRAWCSTAFRRRPPPSRPTSKFRCRRISPTRTTGARRSWSMPSRRRMKAAGKSLEMFRYDADHAFVNEQRMSVHDRKAAELAWGRATEFFRKHLG